MHAQLGQAHKRTRLPQSTPLRTQLFHRLVARMVEQPDYTKNLFTYVLVKDQVFVSNQNNKEGYFDDPVGVGARGVV